MHHAVLRGIVAGAALAATLTLVGCDEPGPLERAGEEMDEAIEDVQNGGETFGNKVDDALDDMRDDIGDATEEAKKKMRGE